MIKALLCFCILNLVYSLGFFITSILAKVGAKHYFLGFDPKLFTFHFRGVSFSVGLYVPIVGLARIYSVVDGKKQRMFYPWEFDLRPIKNRLISTLGGAIALVLVGVSIFIALAYLGEKSIITKEEINKHGIYPSEWAKQLGFQRGDKIIAVNGKDYEEFQDLIDPKVLLSEDSYYTVMRADEEMTIKVDGMPDDFMKGNQLFISLLVPFEVEMVEPNSPAEEAGIKQGDRIRKVNTHSIIKHLDMHDEFKKDEDGIVSLEVERKNEVSLLIMEVTLGEDKKLGIYSRELITYETKKNSIDEAILEGTRTAFASVAGGLRSVAMVISGRLTVKSPVGGPIGIMQSPSYYFWRLTGMYAMWFALWNILPLPKSALLEIIALCYEGVTKKKYPYSAFRKSQNLVWIFGGFFIAWIMFGDLIRLIVG